MRTRFVFAVVFSLAGIALGQSTPQVEVFGGYSHLRFYVPPITTAVPLGGTCCQVPNTDRFYDLHGWESSASVDFMRHVGAEADFSGHYKGDCAHISGVTCSEFSLLFGPRAVFGSPGKNKISGFGQALIGTDRISASDFGISISNTSFAADAGLGLDYWINRRFGIRVAQADYLFTRHFNDRNIPVQHNYRVSAGFVVAFGGHHPEATTATQPKTERVSANGQMPSMAVPALGISVSLPPQGAEGAEIVDVQPGSVAQMAALHVGDLITSVNGSTVKTPMELAAALNGLSGKVKLGYQFRIETGWWIGKETTVVIGK